MPTDQTRSISELYKIAEECDERAGVLGADTVKGKWCASIARRIRTAIEGIGDVVSDSGPSRCEP